jgi:hypothetical protein
MKERNPSVSAGSSTWCFSNCRDYLSPSPGNALNAGNVIRHSEERKGSLPVASGSGRRMFSVARGSKVLAQVFVNEFCIVLACPDANRALKTPPRSAMHYFVYFF